MFLKANAKFPMVVKGLQLRSSNSSNDPYSFRIKWKKLRPSPQLIWFYKSSTYPCELSKRITYAAIHTNEPYPTSCSVYSGTHNNAINWQNVVDPITEGFVIHTIYCIKTNVVGTREAHTMLLYSRNPLHHYSGGTATLISVSRIAS